MKREELQREVFGGGATAEPMETNSIDRWAPQPDQVLGDAKSPRIFAEEHGFDPVRYRDDPAYAARPGVDALASKWAAGKAIEDKAKRDAAGLTAGGMTQSQYESEGTREKIATEEHNAQLRKRIAELEARLGHTPEPKTPAE